MQLSKLKEDGKIDLPYIPDSCTHNGHMFYIKASDINERSALIEYLSRKGIHSVFHYIPLHSSKAGKKFGNFTGEDKFTTKESERLLRLPFYYGLSDEKIERITSAVSAFYK